MTQAFFTKLIKRSLFMLFFLGISDAASIQLFGLSYQPFTHIIGQTKPCYLDRFAKLHQALTGSLHVRPEKWLQNHQSDLKAMKHAYQCQFQAKVLGIQKLPAIVFERHFVIYGMKDVRQAKHSYQAFQEAQK